MRSTARDQGGFTLVELLVGLVLSSIIIAGTLTVFVNARSDYRLTTAMARVQDAGAFATRFIANDIQLAGFFGCPDPLDFVHGLASATPGDLWYIGDDLDANPGGRFGVVIEGIDDFVAGSPNKFSPSGATLKSYKEAGTATDLVFMPGSDVVTVRYLGLRTDNMYVESSTVDAIFVAANDPAEAGFEPGAVIGVSNCGRTEFAVVSSVGAVNNRGIATVRLATSGSSGGAPLSREYNFNDANWSRPVAGRMQAVRYFVACKVSCTESANHRPVPTLYRTRIVPVAGKPAESDAEPLFAGVEALSLWYARDADGNGSAQVFETATSIGNDWRSWHDIVAVRISLVARTLAKFSTEDSTQGPPAYRKRDFDATVHVRNL